MNQISLSHTTSLKHLTNQPIAVWPSSEKDLMEACILSRLLITYSWPLQQKLYSAALILVNVFFNYRCIMDIAIHTNATIHRTCLLNELPSLTFESFRRFLYPGMAASQVGLHTFCAPSLPTPLSYRDTQPCSTEISNTTLASKQPWWPRLESGSWMTSSTN